MTFDEAFELVIGHEGGFTDDPNDKGNWTGGEIGSGKLNGTKFGISAAAYPHLDIKNLDLDVAKRIYYADYWGKAGCEQVPNAVKFDLFDFAVNSGPKTAAKKLQEAVNAVPDGVIGPQTLLCMGGYHPQEVRLRYMALRIRHMRKSKQWDRYSGGWMERLAKNALM